MKLSGWGLYPKHECNVVYPNNIKEVIDLVKGGKLIPRGNGRSYGDSSINIHKTMVMTNLNQIIEFDKKSGVMISESGAMLKDILNKIVPEGWFTHVSPGTKYLTIGGMVAANVHGKNHHRDGSIKNFVEWIELIDQSGKVLICSKKNNSELFDLTFGAMGLTGIITKVCMRLKAIESSFIEQKIIAMKCYGDLMSSMIEHDDSTYSVAWIDCTKKGSSFGKSLLITGEHALSDNKKVKKCENTYKNDENNFLSIPFFMPSGLINNFSIKIFNFIYYFFNSLQKKSLSIVSLNSFFYPLDRILEWNKLYGKKGFFQYQFVIPLASSQKGILEVLQNIQEAKCYPVLAVLKKLGHEENIFSFPMEGFTLSLDFVNTEKNCALMTKLDKTIIKYGGRIYLAKDNRISSEDQYKSDIRSLKFREYRDKYGLTKKFESLQSLRLKL